MNCGDKKLVNTKVILTPTNLSMLEHVMKKNRLTVAEIEEIKTKIRQPINTERQNSEDGRVRKENLTTKKIENTIEEARQ